MVWASSLGQTILNCCNRSSAWCDLPSQFSISAAACNARLDSAILMRFVGAGLPAIKSHTFPYAQHLIAGKPAPTKAKASGPRARPDENRGPPAKGYLLNLMTWMLAA